jgi:hypothetical protein
MMQNANKNCKGSRGGALPYDQVTRLAESELAVLEEEATGMRASGEVLAEGMIT